MSGEGPESIPTSADPRSKRAVKKRALTPLSAQARDVDALFAKPEREIALPAAAAAGGGASGSSSRKRDLPLPPEIVTNVQGSSAGAGSGEFHVYKASRRREYERLRRMDDEVARERAAAAFEAARDQRERRDDDRTRRNREKRERAKARKDRAKAKGADGEGGDAAAPTRPPAKPGVKPRADVTRRADGGGDDDDDDGVAGSPRGENGLAAAEEEPKGIVIEED
ncbi:DUF1168-domain-containing protein [Durotheca rogersii]|uniref:DUF1168-domain-containing protein n=1 Tax=Durotheca rogersii TaxID=419775 RepID=UPI002220509D|nr:DUF1168-domain-containing protein [Durotheca rogersii]KAI5863376.1 DUF1168-domain-containing protein [Durotheca rogersii]